MKQVTTVIGARPQFIKAALLNSRFAEFGISERLLHTGQHYDDNMSDVFFRELGIPKPARNLNISENTHGEQTGSMLRLIESDLIDNRPDAVLVYGDTNSTLAGALSAAKLHIPVIHIEAGLRSFDKWMPEEINRVLTDHISDLLLCPTPTAIRNLKREGFEENVHLVGDVMHSVLLENAARARRESEICEKLGVGKNNFYLCTLHRAENTDNREGLIQVMNTLGNLGKEVIFPMHPRTKHKLETYGWTNSNPRLRIIEPLGYLDVVSLVENSAVVLTDSGGLQKEAFWLDTFCITMRNNTEWIETLEAGWNVLTGLDPIKIQSAVSKFEETADCQKNNQPIFDMEKTMELISSVISE